MKGAALRTARQRMLTSLPRAEALWPMVKVFLQCFLAVLTQVAQPQPPPWMAGGAGSAEADQAMRTGDTAFLLQKSPEQGAQESKCTAVKSRATVAQWACTWRGSGHASLLSYQSRGLIHPTPGCH